MQIFGRSLWFGGTPLLQGRTTSRAAWARGGGLHPGGESRKLGSQRIQSLPRQGRHERPNAIGLEAEAVANAVLRGAVRVEPSVWYQFAAEASRSDTDVVSPLLTVEDRSTAAL